MAEIRASQLPILVEIDQAMVRVSQLVVLVEVEYAPPWPPLGPGGQTPQAGKTSPLSPPPARIGTAPTTPRGRTISPRAQLAAAQRGLSPSARMPRAQAATFGGAPVPMATLAEQRTVAALVEIAWDGTNYVNESGNVVSVNGSLSLLAPLQAIAGGSGTTDACTIQLQNIAGRYSGRLTTGALYATIGGGKWFQRPVRVSVTIGSTTTRLFTGVIRNLSEQTKTPSNVGMITLDCRSKDDLLLRQKVSTPLTTWQASIADAHTEDWHIEALLEAGGLVDGTDFVSQAYATANSVDPSIDPGIFPIDYVWLDDESPLVEAWAVAAAAGGWLYADADGKYHYHNLAGMIEVMLERQYGAIDPFVIDEGEVSGIALAYNDANLASEVVVEVSPRAPGEIQTLWAADAPIVIEPGATKTVIARFDAPAVTIETTAHTARTSGGIDITASVTMTPTYYAQRASLVFVNAAASAAYVYPASITGQTLTGGRTSEMTAAVTGDSFWTAREVITRSIRGNVYIATDTHASALAAYLLADGKRPQLTASISGIDDPTARIGQLATITRTGAINSAVAGVVTGVSWTLDRNGYKHNLTVTDTSNLWTDGTVWFVLGTNKLGASGGALEAYLFY